MLSCFQADGECFGINFSVRVAPKWVCRWPRPEPQGDEVICIRCYQGICELGDLVDLGLRSHLGVLGGSAPSS